MVGNAKRFGVPASLAAGGPYSGQSMRIMGVATATMSVSRRPRAASIDPVNPVTINKLEQIHVVDGIADGDSNRPRSALGLHQRTVHPLGPLNDDAFA